MSTHSTNKRSIADSERSAFFDAFNARLQDRSEGTLDFAGDDLFAFRKSVGGALCCSVDSDSIIFTGEDALLAAHALGCFERAKKYPGVSDQVVFKIERSRLEELKSMLECQGYGIALFPCTTSMASAKTREQAILESILPASASTRSMGRFFAAMDKKYFADERGTWDQPFGTCTYLNSSPAREFARNGFSVGMHGWDETKATPLFQNASLVGGHDFLVAEKSDLTVIVDLWAVEYLGKPTPFTYDKKAIEQWYGPASERTILYQHDELEKRWRDGMSVMFLEWNLHAKEELMKSPVRRKKHERSFNSGQSSMALS